MNPLILSSFPQSQMTSCQIREVWDSPTETFQQTALKIAKAAALVLIAANLLFAEALLALSLYFKKLLLMPSPLPFSETALRIPYIAPLPTSGTFVAHALADAFKNMMPEDAAQFRNLLDFPNQENPPIDPYLWAAGCSIVHYLCCARLASPRQLDSLGCPPFLAPFLHPSQGERYSLRQLLAAFCAVRASQRIELQASIAMKIREPSKNWEMDDFSKALVDNIWRLAQEIASQETFRYQVFPQAIVLAQQIQH